MMGAACISLLDIIIEDISNRHAGSDEQSWAKFQSGSSDDDGNARNRRNYANSWTSEMRMSATLLGVITGLFLGSWAKETYVQFRNEAGAGNTSIILIHQNRLLPSVSFRIGCFCEDEASREHDDDKWVYTNAIRISRQITNFMITSDKLGKDSNQNNNC